MLNTFKGLSKLIFVLGIMGSITFGASEAVAAKATAPCFDPPDWLGECASEQDCDEICSLAGGTEGDCHPNGCCACAYF